MLIKHQKYKLVLKLYSYHTAYVEKSIELIKKYNILIDKDLIEQLTPNKQETKEYRQQILISLAELCVLQHKYHLACKKYTQAGQINEAIKCLLKTNDITQIIYYTQRIKKISIYILVANYLQSLTIHDDMDEKKIQQTIIKFYNKAKAYHLLASYYMIIAQK